MLAELATYWVAWRTRGSVGSHFLGTSNSTSQQQRSRSVLRLAALSRSRRSRRCAGCSLSFPHPHAASGAPAGRGGVFDGKDCLDMWNVHIPQHSLKTIQASIKSAQPSVYF
ncbi:uncharacterized protein GJ701_002254 [Geothlypis trichas]